MDFSLTKEEAMIQRMAREFAEKYVAPIAEQIERENHLPQEIIEGMAELDLFGLPFDPKFGGTGAGYLAYVLALEQLSRISTSLQTVLSVNVLGLGAIDKFGTEEQKMRYMPVCCKGKQLASFAFTEPGTGSDPKQLTTTAVKQGDSYIINGTKRFISNANYPGPIVVFALESESGKPTGFIIDKFCEGYSLSEPWDKIGGHGSLLLDIYLKDVKVPAENVLGQVGFGYPILQFGISFGKIGMCAGGLGLILACYEEAMKYVKEKTHRGDPIAKFQAVQLRIADLAIKLETARWLVYHLGYLANNIKNPAVFAKDAALCKTYICDTAVDASRVAIDVHGSYGLMNEYKVTRLYRDAIMGPQVEGVADMQKLIVAGVLLS